MAEKTLYEILELSETASPESVRAAWDRLSARFNPNRAENATDPATRTRYAAVKEAYLTLGNPQKRAAYDQRLNARWNAAVNQSFHLSPKAAFVLIALFGLGAYGYNAKQERARIQSEKAIATAIAQEAADKARAEAEHASVEQQKALDQKAHEERTRHQREADLREIQR